MARPTRRAPRGVARYPVRSNVHNITNLAQWTRLHRRAKKRLVFVMYSLEFVRNHQRLKSTLVELSQHSEFQDVLFAVVDIERGSEVAEQENIRPQDAPMFICYQSQSIVDRLERVNGDTAPASLWQMLHRNAVRIRAETARATPNVGQNTYWRSLRKAALSLVFGVGSVLLLVLMKPVPQREAYERDIHKTKRSRRAF